MFKRIRISNNSDICYPFPILNKSTTCTRYMAWESWSWLSCACTHTIIKVRCHAATHSLHTTYQRPCLVVVRSGTAGLLIDIEYSRAMDSSWMYLISFVTIRICIELAAVQMKLLDCVVVGLQLYSARTFHVTLPHPPDI